MFNRPICAGNHMNNVFVDKKYLLRIFQSINALIVTTSYIFEKWKHLKVLLHFICNT